MNKFPVSFIFFLLFPLLISSQNNLSLEDAVLKRWSSLAPEKLNNLQWNNEKDFFSYKFSDSLIYICKYNNQLIDSISLSQINNFLEDSSKLAIVPSITWLDSHSFRFKKNNQFYVYNRKRGQKATPSFLVKDNAKNIEFNKQQTKYAYTLDNNLYVAQDHNLHFSVSKEDDKSIVFGQAVHRYEFGIYKGTFWSNDGSKLAFYRKDESMVTDYPLMNISSRVGYADMIKYPMAGMASHHVTVGIFNTRNEQIIYLETGEPREQYLTNISWGPNDQYLYIAVLNRDQNHLKFNKYNASDGSFVKTLFEEKSSKYVQPLHCMEFISDDVFLWRSERDGYDNFFIYNTDGELIKKLLNKKHLVKDYYGYKNDSIYFSCFTKDGLGVDLWSVSYLSKYKRKIVDDGNYHSFMVSPSKSYFINTYSSVEIPSITRIINNEGNNIVELLKSKDPLKDYKIGSTDLIKIKTAKSISLNARVVKPYHFDENKKYPALIYVYNGPGVQLIRNNWLASAPLWMHYLANQGYIVFTIDGRGSENRGRDFEQIIFGELGKVEMEDQIKGYEYLVKQPYIDASRIAVHGWSYGGFMTTNLLLNYPDLFTCGVAGGPVTNWMYYEVMYTERYMDHPEKNKEGYENTNLVNKASLLKDPLLMIHGLIDDVVLPQHSLDFIKASVSSNIQMDYFIYPTHPHNVRGRDRVHLIQKMINFIILNNNF